MKEQKMRKLHNPETGRHWYMRIVSLLLVAVLLWIGLENTLYPKEEKIRSALRDIRKEYARESLRRYRKYKEDRLS